MASTTNNTIPGLNRNARKGDCFDVVAGPWAGQQALYLGTDRFGIRVWLRNLKRTTIAASNLCLDADRTARNVAG